MADALASGASARKGVGVQVPPRARFRRERHSSIPRSLDLFPTPESFHRLIDAKGISEPIEKGWGQESKNPNCVDHAWEEQLTLV